MLSFSLTAMTAGTRGAFLVVILGLRFVRHQPCCFINVDLVHVSLIPFIDTGYILYKRPNYQLKDSLLHEVKELTYKPTWRKNRQWRHTSFYQPRSHEVMPKCRPLQQSYLGVFENYYGWTSRFENETNRISPKTHQYCAYYGQRGPKLKPKNLKKKKTKIKSFARGGREPMRRNID